jgi:hypothetical protein
VRVAERLVDAVVPAPTLNVELDDTERDRSLHLTVTSTDGRVATATAEPGATEIAVTFGDKPRPRATPAPPTTVKHPWSKK